MNDIESEIAALSQPNIGTVNTTQETNLNDLLSNNMPLNTVPTTQVPVDNNLDPNMLGNYNYAQPVAPTVGTFVPDSGFNFANTDIQLGQPLYEKNPIDRLVGERGDVYRVCILPKVPSKSATVHWDAEKGHNIICLKNAYNTEVEPCCKSHGPAKTRVVVPVVLYPTVKGNPNALIPGQKAELRVLVLGYKSYEDLIKAMRLIGVPEGQESTVDIFASVDNPTYKSFKFTVDKTSMLNQVSNLQELINKWNTDGTTENTLKLCGKLITRAEYDASYANYDFKKYEAAKQLNQNFNVTADNYGQPMQGGAMYNPGAQFNQSIYNQPGGWN